jgi:mono/diheme cytochrome c family protein
MNPKHLLGIVLAASAFLIPLAAALQAQTDSTAKPPAVTSQQPATNKASVQSHSEGERIFMQNCSRCHTAPDGFSPSISGTVVHHMRVRASLSRHDEQELLRYFNP